MQMIWLDFNNTTIFYLLNKAKKLWWKRFDFGTVETGRKFDLNTKCT